MQKFTIFRDFEFRDFKQKVIIFPIYAYNSMKSGTLIQGEAINFYPFEILITQRRMLHFRCGLLHLIA
jgi:hypothetical protein